MDDKFFIELLKTHQDLKREYLKIGSHLGSNCNSFTLNWIKKNTQSLDPFINSLLGGDYNDIRKLYIVSPSLHELWYFDIHFWHLMKNILYGRLGLKAVLTSRRNNTSIDSSTFLLRRAILIENMLGSDLMLNASPLYLSQENFNLLTNSVDSLNVDFQFFFSLIKGLIDLSRMENLVKTWKFYSPCTFNEGPIFDNPISENILEIVNGASRFENKKEYLKQNFDIVEYYSREELF